MPVKLREEQIENLRELYRKKYGKELTIQEAQSFGIYLIQLVKSVLNNGSLQEE